MMDRVIYFGKYRGKDVRLIPSSYLVWVHNTIDKDLSTELKIAIEQEMVRRFKMIDHRRPEHDTILDFMDTMATEQDLY